MPFFKVFVINGSGGSGKDSFCKFFEEFYREDKTNMNFKDNSFHEYMCLYTSIPAKKIAQQMGWNGKKTLLSRKYLCELKDMYDFWDNATVNYLKKNILGWYDIYKNAYSTPVASSYIIFIHAREAKDISFIENLCENNNIYYQTILVDRRNNREKKGNHADDNVKDYKYHWYIHNDDGLDELKAMVQEFYKIQMSDELIKKENFEKQNLEKENKN